MKRELKEVSSTTNYGQADVDCKAHPDEKGTESDHFAQTSIVKLKLQGPSR